MRAFVRALVEIAAPALAPHLAQRAGVMFKNLEWGEKIHLPRARFTGPRINDLGKRGPHFNPAADLGGQPREFLESPRHTLRVFDVIAKMRAARVHLQIEI